jgi:KDO2-lipid IV(A) lauroyltransferase
MNILRVIRYPFEVVLLGLGFLLIPPLPRSWVAGLARFLGCTGFRFSRELKEQGRANLAMAYGESLPEPERDAILKECFVTQALVGLDLFWFAVPGRIRRYVRFDPSFDQYFRTTPLIGVTGHLGNWELVGQSIAMAGCPTVSVAAPLANPVAGRILDAMRRRTGQLIVSKEGAIRSLMRALKNGGRVGLLMDQNTVPRDGGEFVTFFGRPVPVSKAVAVLSIRTGAPAVPVFCVPEEGGLRYQVHCLPPIPASLSPDGATGPLTQAMTDAMELEVRRYPGKWLWMYKRWKYIPPGTSETLYPYYGRRASPAHMGENA